VCELCLGFFVRCGVRRCAARCARFCGASLPLLQQPLTQKKHNSKQKNKKNTT
jgi:hypothetical protein